MAVEILFVCMGNICRSPAAEGIMNHLIKHHHLENRIRCDSAGTLSYHTGESADPRMQQFAQKRGYQLTSHSRPFKKDSDFEHFDFIITMDQTNYHDIQAQDPLRQYSSKIHKMTSFCRIHDALEVPDPYYGKGNGFDFVLNLLEDACQGLLEKIRKDQNV